MIKTFLTFRLRIKRDKDLIEAIKLVDDGDLSEMIRKGLRLVLKCDTALKSDISTSSSVTSHNVTQENDIKKAPIKWHFPEGNK